MNKTVERRQNPYKLHWYRLWPSWWERQLVKEGEQTNTINTYIARERDQELVAAEQANHREIITLEKNILRDEDAVAVGMVGRIIGEGAWPYNRESLSSHAFTRCLMEPTRSVTGWSRLKWPSYVIADRDKPIVSVLRLLPDCDRVTRSDEKGFKATSRR